MIKSLHVLIAGSLTPESLGACIALEGGRPVIEGIHVLFAGPLTREGTRTGLALVHTSGATAVVKVWLYGDFGQLKIAVWVR